MTDDTDHESPHEFEHAGLNCRLVYIKTGHWCGYVQRPDDVEPVRWMSDISEKGEVLDAEVDVWGGITYGPDDDGWVGFDDAHAQSIADIRGEDSDFEAVRDETKRLAEQVADLRGDADD
jgi:hypothetical protein